jgi:hypothetical protein
MMGLTYLFATFILRDSIKDSIQVVRSWSWNSQVGVIYESGVAQQRGRRNIQKYWCSVFYTYEINKVPFTGSTLTFEKNQFSAYRPAFQECQRFAINSKIKIKYDPDNPLWSCYKCAMPGQIWFIYFVTVTLGMFGLFMFFSSMRVLWPEPERWI